MARAKPTANDLLLPPRGNVQAPASADVERFVEGSSTRRKRTRRSEPGTRVTAYLENDVEAALWKLHSETRRSISDILSEAARDYCERHGLLPKRP